MSHDCCQVKGRVTHALPFPTLSVTLTPLLGPSAPLSDEDALAALSETEQFPKRWARFAPLFIPCGNLSNVRVVVWVQPTNRPPGEVFDRMVCCLVWRDGQGTVHLNSTCWIVMRHHVDLESNGWDGAVAEPDCLLLSRPTGRRLVA